MRVTKVLSNILGMKSVRVLGCEFEECSLVIDVAPTTRIARCSGCGCRVRRLYDRRHGRRWRHLDLGGMRVELRYDVRRADCVRCGVRTELVPWAEPDSMFTRPLDDQVGYLAQRMDKTAVVELMGIAWYTVGSIIERVVGRLSPPDRLTNQRVIGIDELSYRKHHEYVTIITDHESGKVVWAREGKNAATLDAFFAELGSDPPEPRRLDLRKRGRSHGPRLRYATSLVIRACSRISSPPPTARSFLATIAQKRGEFRAFGARPAPLA